MFRKDLTAPLSPPGTYLIRMILFLLASGGVVLALGLPSDRLHFFFNSNPALNGLIIGVLALGIIYACRYVALLWPEIRWVNLLSAGAMTGTRATTSAPQLLSPLAAMISRSGGRLILTQTSLASIMDSISARMEETREILRYMIGLLVFLGLLGTFWGLLITVSSVSELISSLSKQGDADSSALFAQLIGGLNEPLAGMGTAFSSSLFGLAGSLVLGFLDLQLGQAQNRFVMELEDWLSTSARFALEGGSDNQPQDDFSDITESLDQLLARLRQKR